jgi:hypothetical protein
VIWRVRAAALILASVVFSIVTAKVLSIQYVFWLFPLAVMLPGRGGTAIMISYFAALAMGRLWFPNYWTAVEALTQPAMILIFCRNMLLLGIAIVAAIIAARYRPEEAK